MADFFVIRLGERAGAPVEWVAVGDDGTLRGAPAAGTLAEAAAAAGGLPVIVLVPGTEVLTAFTAIPAKGARLMAALPYALEDQLADDVDNLHFAPGKREDDGRLPVAIVARSRMQEWLAALAAAGVAPARVVPENHGLARIPNTLSLLATADRVMFNDGGDLEFVIPGLSPAEALATTGVLDASADDPAAPRHLLAYCDAAVAGDYERDWAILRQELDGVDVNLLGEGPLPRLAVTVASGTGINLLQGQYGDRTRFAATFRPWRHAAMLVAALFVAGLVVKGVDYYRLNNERDALQAQFTSEYRRLRPNDEREIADPAATIDSLRRSRGAAAAGPQVFLPLLQSLAQAVAASEAVVVEAVSYRAGVVDVRLVAPDITTLDEVVQSIGSSGRFSASLQSADTVNDRVNSRVQIREAGS
ncbi:MAG TPA: type II secretion system protein GspL [Woeseiaceae bacterium]|nr:type II secretion system protein GspL [Woeseiaceae bacterium]